MSPVTNGKVIFNSIPTGYPEPGKTTVYDDSEKIDVDTVALNGGALVKVLYQSIDPYMRGRMRRPEVTSYSPAYTLGQPLTGYGVGVVVRSQLPELKTGDHVYGILEHRNYTVLSNAKTVRVIDGDNEKYNLPWSYYVGVSGMPGKTAYMAWKEFSRAQKGEVAFVTAGAGPVGSFVIQLAKADGLKVIASAGSEEKVAYMKSIGADVVFNYKTTNTLEILNREGGIDIYWDNVGGETLDAALEAAKTNSRFIECGMISAYNGTGQIIKNIKYVLEKSISMNGFIVGRIQHKYDRDFYAEVPALVANGTLKYKEHVYQGLESVGDAILDVQKGKNQGKAVVKVADE